MLLPKSNYKFRLLKISKKSLLLQQKGLFFVYLRNITQYLKHTYVRQLY